MSASPSIAVVEPQASNLFHSPFNAALLHSIVLAFPKAKISFRALPDHAAAVRSILEDFAPEIVSIVEWRALEAPARTSTLSRWRTNHRNFRQALAAGERVVFCSISRMQLLQLKRMIGPGADVLAVLHGDLERITEPGTKRFPRGIFSLQRILLTRHPAGLRFILLGESIRRNIPAKFLPAFTRALVIDHPYHFPAVKQASKKVTGAADPIVFGLFGSRGDGRLLQQVASEVKAVNPGIVFRIVGFVSDAEAAARLAPLVEGLSTEPISRREFIERAESVTYALWLAPADSFRLRASGTFFDALAFQKPLVYVANAFIDAYLGAHIDASTTFAHSCATPEDVPAAILHVPAQHDAVEYLRAQAAIREFRVRFTPEALALTLPSKFGW